MAETREHPIDLFQSTRPPPPIEKGRGLGDEKPHDRNEKSGCPATKDEDVVPRAAAQDSVHNQTAENSPDGVTNHHQSHRQPAPAAVGKFRGRGVDRRQHPADSEPGQQTEAEQFRHACRIARTEHADRHADETQQNRLPPAHLISHGPEQNGADRHAEQFRRQDPAEHSRTEAPVPRNARRGKADRQNVEAIKRIEPDRDQHGDPLRRIHRAVLH